jgi:Tfp pilus assembly PilM family ATPase
LSRKNEISATEKLLDVIRDKRHEDASIKTPPPSDAKLPQAPRKKGFKFPIKSIIPVQKRLTVGIDIGHDCLRLVKIRRNSDLDVKLLDFRSVSFPPHAPRDSAEFDQFLKGQINAFSPPEQKAQIWVNMSAARVDVHHTRIPKVPKAHIESAVFWTVRKEMSLDERENIIDFEIQGETTEQGVPKILVMYYSAPRQQIEEIRRLFSRIGVPLTGIAIAPFATQNIFRHKWVHDVDGTVASLFIGNDFSRIDIYAGGNLVMTRGIKAGSTSMIESLMENFNETLAGSQDERFAGKPLDMTQAKRILFSLSQDSLPLKEEEAGFGLSKEEVFGMIQNALDRLTRQVDRTVEYYTVTLGNPRIDKLYIASVMSVYHPMIDYIGEQLGVPCDILDPLNPEIIGHEWNEDLANTSDRIAFGPAVGLALSDNARTPNFIFTYRDKEKAAQVTRINKAVFIVFVAMVSVCTAVFIYQGYNASLKKVRIDKLQTELAQFNPVIDREGILKVAAKTKEQRQMIKTYRNRYLGLAVMGELSILTPANIHLIKVQANLGITPVQASEPGKDAAGGPPKIEETSGLDIEGLVWGSKDSLEAILAGYVSRLQTSPLFHKVSVEKSAFEPLKKTEVLHFIIRAKTA